MNITLHDTDIGRYGSECTVAQFGSLFKLKLLKDDDDKVLNELGVAGCCAWCGRCTGSACPRKQDKILQVPNPVPQPPLRPLTPSTTGAAFSDTVYDSMSNSDSEDTGLSDTMNVFPAPSAIPRMHKEPIQQITSEVKQSDAAIKSLLVQLDDFVVQRQESKDFNL
ncbi:hypothetical protein BGZ59_001358 [Podila verticillata]|nr:hypothetical protein BGZ59_001358 [Podila verticillata]